MRETLAVIAEGLLPPTACRSWPTPMRCIRPCKPCCACRPASGSTQAAPPRLLEALVRAAALALEGEPPPADFAALERRLVESQRAVRQIFDELCPPGK